MKRKRKAKVNTNTCRVFLLFVTYFLAGYFLVGCVGTNHIVTGTPLAPTQPASIKIYSKPPSSFKEIAIIDAEANALIDVTETKDETQVIQKMKEIAASLGANGILIRKSSHKTSTIGAGYGLSSSQADATDTSAATSNTQADNAFHGVAIFVLQEE
jgi:hypothetical protein